MHMVSNLYSWCIGNIVSIAPYGKKTEAIQIVTNCINKSWNYRSPHLQPVDFKKCVEKSIHINILQLFNDNDNVNITYYSKNNQLLQKKIVLQRLIDAVLVFKKLIYSKRRIDNDKTIPRLEEARNIVLATFACFRWPLHATLHYATNHFIEDIYHDYFINFPVTQHGNEESGEAAHKNIKCITRALFKATELHGESRMSRMIMNSVAIRHLNKLI